METLTVKILDYLKGQSFQVAVVFAVVLILAWLLRNRSAHIRYLLWLLVAIKCLTPPMMIFFVPVLPNDTSAVIELPMTVEVSPQTATQESFAAPTPEKTRVIPMQLTEEPKMNLFKQFLSAPANILLCIWAAGGAFYLLWAAAKAIRLQAWLKQNHRPVGPQMAGEIEELSRLWNSNKVFTVRLVDNISQPFVWGLWRGAIYLPSRIQSIQTDRQKAVVMHEMAHVIRWDSLLNLLQILIQGLFWFHPLVWLANRFIRQEREKCCDETAIARLNTHPKEYGSAIIETLVQEYHNMIPIPSLAVAGPIKNIEDRIKTIMQPGRRFFRRPSIIALLIIGCLAALVVPTAIALTQQNIPSNHTVSGAVTDAQTEAPIAGAIVFDDGYNDNKGRTITGADGKFELKTWNEEHFISAGAKGYESHKQLLKTFPFANNKNFNFQLRKILSDTSSAAGTTNSPFVATLPDGVTVELIGICEYPSKDKTWWAPDGSPLAQQIITQDDSNYTNKGKPYEITYKISIPDDVTVDMPQTKGSAAQSGLTVKKPAGLKAYRTHLNLWGNTTTVSFPVAAGAWKTLGTTNGKGQTSSQVGSGKIMFSPAVGSAEKLILTVSDDLKRFDDYRLIAIDKQGGIHPGNRNWFSIDNMRQSTFTFTGLDPESVDRYEFQTRPFLNIEFKNVSLKVGKKTSVKIEVPAELKVSSAPPAAIFDNPKFQKRFFITIVADKDNNIFSDGQKVTFEQFEAMMPQCPEPARTVLEVAFEPGALPKEAQDELSRGNAPWKWLGQNPLWQRAGQLVQKYHLEYPSFVGEDHPETRRAPLSIRMEDTFVMDKDIAVAMSALSLQEDKPLLTLDTVRFAGGDPVLAAKLDMTVISHPKKNWQVKMRLFDKTGGTMETVTKFYQNSGVIKGGATVSKDLLIFNFKKRDLSTIAKFEIELRQTKNVPGQKTEVKIETQNSGVSSITAATLEFRVVPNIGEDISEGTLKQYKESLETNGPDGNFDGYKWVVANTTDNATWYNNLPSHRYKDAVYILLCDRPDKRMLANGTWGLQKVSVDTADQHYPSILAEFDDTGASQFQTLTQQNVGRRLALIVNGKIISAPQVKSPISKQAAITGHFTNEELGYLTQALIKGMPPAGPKVTVEARFILADEAVLKQAGINLNKTFGTVTTLPADSNDITDLFKNNSLENMTVEPSEPNLLIDPQLKLLIESVQQNKNGKMLTSPKALVRNNEQATIKVTMNTEYFDAANNRKKIFNKEIQLTVCPQADNAGQNIAVKVRVLMSDLLKPDTQQAAAAPQAQVLDIPYQTTVPDKTSFWLLAPQGFFEPLLSDENTTVNRRLLILIRPAITTSNAQTTSPQSFGGMGGGGGGGIGGGMSGGGGFGGGTNQ